MANNAFFVSKDAKLEAIQELTGEEEFVVAGFRESRNEKGGLNYLSQEKEHEII